MADHQNDKTDFEDLDALFAEAREVTPELPDRLMSAILADATAEQARWQEAPAKASRAGLVARRGPLALLVMALGGWGSVGGLIAASCTGLWIGIAAPDAAQWAPGLNQTAASTAFSSDEYAAYETFDLASVLAEDLQ